MEPREEDRKGLARRAVGGREEEKEEGVELAVEGGRGDLEAEEARDDAAASLFRLR